MFQALFRNQEFIIRGGKMICLLRVIVAFVGGFVLGGMAAFIYNKVAK